MQKQFFSFILILFVLFSSCKETEIKAPPIPPPGDKTPNSLAGTKWVHHENTPNWIIANKDIGMKFYDTYWVHYNIITGEEQNWTKRAYHYEKPILETTSWGFPAIGTIEGDFMILEEYFGYVSLSIIPYWFVLVEDVQK